MLLLLFSLSGCKISDKENNIKKEVINIGAVLSLTGEGSEYGKDQQRAIDLFIEQKNNQKSKYIYKVKTLDSKSDPKVAVSAINNLISVDRPDAVLSVLSSVCLSIKPITENNNIPLFCVGANPEITSNTKLVFRSLPTSDYQAEVLGNLFISQKKVRSFSILYLNNDFGIGSLNSIKSAIRINNKELLDSMALDPAKTDYKTEVAKVLTGNPDVIYVAAYGSSIAYVLRNLTELGYNKYILSALEVSYPNVLGIAKSAAENVYYVDTVFQNDDNKNNTFIKAFKAKYNTVPTLDAILAYDEMSVIYKTFESYGKSNYGFMKIKGNDLYYESANGNFKINKNGDFLYPLGLMKIVAGKPELIKKY